MIGNFERACQTCWHCACSRANDVCSKGRNIAITHIRRSRHNLAHRISNSGGGNLEHACRGLEYGLKKELVIIFSQFYNIATNQIAMRTVKRSELSLQVEYNRLQQLNASNKGDQIDEG
jgi:hypothetical protein